MTDELRKRPFARPLLFWIAGFVLQLCFPVATVSWVLLFPVAAVLLYSFLPVQRKEGCSFLYEYRWVWGLAFLCLILFLSIQMTAYREQGLLLPPASPNGLQAWAAEQQMHWVGKLERLRLTEAERSVLATLTAGYRQAMDPEVNRQFIVAGVVHLLSVSGFHVAVVGCFVSYLFALLPRRPFFRLLNFLLTFAVVWGYTCLTGLAVPAVRSAVMLTIFLAGRLLRRNTDSYNTLFASAFLMLVYQPFYLLDIGFQLSYLAVFSILYFQPRLSRWIPLRNPLLKAPWEAITVTLSAQTGTFFLCCYYFGQFSTVFLFTNLPITFLSGILLPVTLLWIVLPEWFPLVGCLQAGAELLTKSLLWVVESFSRVPGATLRFHFDFLSMLGGYLLLFLLLCYWRNKQVKRLFFLLGALFLWLVYQIILALGLR